MHKLLFNYGKATLKMTKMTVDKHKANWGEPRLLGDCTKHDKTTETSYLSINKLFMIYQSVQLADFPQHLYTTSLRILSTHSCKTWSLLQQEVADLETHAWH